MKAFLMYRDRDFDPERKLPPNELAMTQDLELNTLFGAMGAGDKFLFDLARRAVLGSEQDLDAIRYRQDILRDGLKNPDVIRAMYGIAVESLGQERRRYLGLFAQSPSLVLYRSVDVLGMFVEMLVKLRQVADENAGKFQSEGFVTLFAMLKRELTDDYFAELRAHLKRMKFRGGVLISAELGKGNKGINYVLRRARDADKGWLDRLLTRPRGYRFRLHPRDENGARAIAELRDRGINLIANALGQSTDHIVSFFHMLRVELAFYVGCLNLHEELARRGEPVCFPDPLPLCQRNHAFRGLYDVCLALTLPHHVVGNEVAAEGKDLTIITGANQGGKSTFLRSVGVAQLMMQCGMFAPADAFSADVCAAVFTHYKREEDPAMKSGKLDEELGRMSMIVDELRPNALMLFNESFAATNEREGSEIARQIVRALLEKHIKIFFVTHFYDLANGFWEQRAGNTLFLRAERRGDGERTFRLIVGKPLETSYGQDLYDKIFGGPAVTGAPEDALPAALTRATTAL
jgi:DNA mismatch repair ATPase MutS